MLGKDMYKMLHNAIPTAYHYRALRKALIRYLKIKQSGQWHKLALKGSLRPGGHAQGVSDLREYLKATGDYHACDKSSEGDTYDACLVKAVKHFQKRHGLSPDGVLGSGTLRILNTPIEQRITKLRLNLDRIKWLNPRQPHHHIIINIPFFRLYFEEDGKVIDTMKVITGKPNHPTPIFSDEVEMIVLNPYWNVPTSIIQKEMIPKLLNNPHAMKRKGIEIYKGWGSNAKKIDPSTVDWGQYLYSKTVPYRFAQTPGHRNALGKIKFLFPNRFSVYMHDTPTKPLFRRTRRAFSHGCVRLEKPQHLLKTFASFEHNISLKHAQKVLKGKESTTLALKEKVPVDIIYLTAWVDYKGELQFRDDVYHYDKMQLHSYKRW